MRMPARDTTPDGFEGIYREHVRFVLAAARAFGVPALMVDDVAQDVFVTMYRKRGSLDETRSLRPFLYAVTRRTAFRYRRSIARTVRRREALQPLTLVASEVDEDAPRWLRRFLETLEPEQRETLILAELLGMTGSEIAEAQGVPLNTAYSRLRLARRRLSELAQSPDHARMLLEAAREPTPSQPRQARIWAALLPALHPAASVAATGLGSAALVLAGLALGGLVVRAVLPRPDPELGEAKFASADAPPNEARSQAVPTPAESQRTASTIVGEMPAATASVATVAVGPRPSPRRPPAGAPPSERRPDTLSSELLLINAAQRELAQGNAGGALEELKLHEKRFPQGQLADVRAVHRVAALRALGRAQEADATAAAAHCRHPDSNVVRTLTENSSHRPACRDGSVAEVESPG